MKRTVFWLVVAAGFIALQAMAAEYHLWDTDRDGKVSQQEFINAQIEKVKKEGKPFNEADAVKRFKRRDKNSDGVLTDEELGLITLG